MGANSSHDPSFLLSHGFESSSSLCDLELTELLSLLSLTSHHLPQTVVRNGGMTHEKVHQSGVALLWGFGSQSHHIR